MIKRFSLQFSESRVGRIFWHARFGLRKHCISCSYCKLWKLSDRRLECARCHKRFTLTTYTYLNFSTLALDKWFELIWWFVYGFTPHKAAEELQTDQKLLHRCFSTIRKAIYDYEEAEMEKLVGTVEVDETYIGPKFKNRKKRKREYLKRMGIVNRGRGAKKLLQPVFGMYQREGLVYIQFIKDAGKKTLQDIIRGKVELESVVYSDTWRSYEGLDTEGYTHETIDHGNSEYVREGTIHINGIEGFWGYLKERLRKHHGVAQYNLIYYVKEQEFRFNHKHLSSEKIVEKIIHILMNSTP
ncbi:MAG: IS1595 family transposase [Thermodesulfobacteriota bacterium]